MSVYCWIHFNNETLHKFDAWTDDSPPHPSVYIGDGKYCNYEAIREILEDPLTENSAAEILEISRDQLDDGEWVELLNFLNQNLGSTNGGVWCE
jgi:hypothetical protein